MPRWYAQPQMEEDFWCIVSEAGEVICPRVPDQATAKQICTEHADHEEAVRLLADAGFVCPFNSLPVGLLRMLKAFENQVRGAA